MIDIVTCFFKDIPLSPPILHLTIVKAVTNTQMKEKIIPTTQYIKLHKNFNKRSHRGSVETGVRRG